MLLPQFVHPPNQAATLVWSLLCLATCTQTSPSSHQTSSLVSSLFESKPGHFDKMFGTFDESERLQMLQLAQETFSFAYDNYMKHAFPADELNPIYCNGRGPDLKDR